MKEVSKSLFSVCVCMCVREIVCLFMCVYLCGCVGVAVSFLCMSVCGYEIEHVDGGG